MKAVVYQVPYEFAVTAVPDRRPGEVRLLTSDRGRTCGRVTQVLELDDPGALSLLRDGPAWLKAVLAP